MDIESNNDVEGSKARVRLEGAGSFRDEGAQVIPGGSPWTYQLWVQGCHASGRRRGVMDPILCRETSRDMP